jgi:glutathione S-transferase
MRTLYGIPYSPWSEKARWALDHHGVPYAFHAHVPFLGEPLLRAKAGRLRGRATVPLLVDEAGTTTESFEIARRAEAIGRGRTLFPADRLNEIRRFNESSDRIMDVGRGVVLRNLLRDPQAQREALPPFVPDVVRWALTPMTRVATRFIARKYGASPRSDDDRVVTAALQGLRAALDGKAYLLSELTYADIAMAAAMQFVSPVSDEYIPLGPATRSCWSLPHIARDFADLVAWRDELYRRHRRAVSQ